VVKVTTNYEEYQKLSGSDYVYSNTLQGLYYNKVIWLKRLGFKTLFHEVVHYILDMDIFYTRAGIRLFCDILNSIHDGVWHSIRYDNMRSVEGKRTFIKNLKENINDWLDWVLCRN
jgi:hypothetical protein